MREFPDILTVKKKDKYPDIYKSRVLCYFRKDVYEHVISHDENSYFDLERFGKKYYNNHKDREKITTDMSNTIILELEKLGWKCKKSFGDTALFIYSSIDPPPSCWDDGL